MGAQVTVTHVKNLLKRKAVARWMVWLAILVWSKREKPAALLRPSQEPHSVCGLKLIWN